MRRSPLTRKTPLKATTIRASGRRLRQSRSTGKPTKAQSGRFERLKRSGCRACDVNARRWWAVCDGEGCDAHHLLSGGRRIGHDATIALCPWHHRGIRPADCATDADAFHKYGPSLANGSKPFRETYGTDDELLAEQNRILETEQ